MDEIDLRSIPTEILLEEIARREAIVSDRKKYAQYRLTAVAQAEGERLLFGVTSYTDQLGWKALICATLIVIGFFGGAAFALIPPPYEYDVSVCMTLFLIGLIGVAYLLRLRSRSSHIVETFKQLYPKEAKLLGYA